MQNKGLFPIKVVFFLTHVLDFFYIFRIALIFPLPRPLILIIQPLIVGIISLSRLMKAGFSSTAFHSLSFSTPPIFVCL